MVWWMWTTPFVPSNPFAANAPAPADAQADTQKHLAALAEHGSQACCHWNEESGFYHFSQNWLRITGVAPDDAMGDQFIEHLHPNSRSELIEGLKLLFSSDPFEQVESYRFDAQIMRGDGYWGWIELTMVPLQSRGRKMVSLLVCDSTNRKQMEETLEYTQRQSEVATMGRSSFLSNMSHELRTPLNAILGFAQLLRERSAMDDEIAQDYLQLIQDSGQELLIKITDLIELANIDANCARLDESPMNMADIVRAAVEMHSHAAFEQNIPIKQEYSSPQVVLRGDRTKLIHVLSNLLINAIRHSNTQEAVTITCRASEESGISISVRDRGCGIPHGHLGSIKDALKSRQSYYCTDISSVRLGLSISKEFIELHGGKLCIESIPGEGTIATLFLPASRIVSMSARVKPKRIGARRVAVS